MKNLENRIQIAFLYAIDRFKSNFLKFVVSFFIILFFLNVYVENIFMRDFLTETLFWISGIILLSLFLFSFFKALFSKTLLINFLKKYLDLLEKKYQLDLFSKLEDSLRNFISFTEKRLKEELKDITIKKERKIKEINHIFDLRLKNLEVDKINIENNNKPQDKALLRIKREEMKQNEIDNINEARIDEIQQINHIAKREEQEMKKPIQDLIDKYLSLKKDLDLKNKKLRNLQEIAEEL